jgi:hypothetical protein
MEQAKMDRCLTCQGAGEVGSESGPLVCPDCFGEGHAVGRGATFEWRLRQIEQRYQRAGGEMASDVAWLVHELRRSREALVGIFARCQDAERGDAMAAEIQYRANEALGLYAATPELRSTDVEA